MIATFHTSIINETNLCGPFLHERTYEMDRLYHYFCNIPIEFQYFNFSLNIESKNLQQRNSVLYST